ncbi:Signal recognition particle protein [Planctomycetes bacterium Pan216]|uniref:Signal recognition particle protein n=1 Tax=Kolteria novifilia TaxID=2527975 RepID=A0A518AXE7_9BACT|nr:Signal recognition particle protein [Planctomycetes bacterium Pan216]
MFETIQQGLGSALKSLRGGTRFTEANMREGLRSVRRALLEADVQLDVANTFVTRVEEAALGREVLKSVRPSEQIVQIVYEELVNLMGPVDSSIRLNSGRPTVLMMCGLQGSGKTTTCGKLARMLHSQGQHPLLVAADLQRPAAIEQLKVLGEQLGIPVHFEDSKNPVSVCQNAMKVAKSQSRNVVILDTAGRLHVDDELMKELEQIDRKVGPDQCILVADSMTGQDAVQSAKSFNDALELDAVILTKLDGDARGGAALSIKEVTGVPIKFVGMGEKLDALEPFRPDGMASRILGMGDVLSLVEKAQEAIDEEEALRQQEKMERGKFDLNDFRTQLERIGQMGSMRSLLEMMPGGLGNMLGEDADPEQELKRVRAMLDSMTPHERAQPDVIGASRRRRIALGSGVQPHEVNGLIKQFEQMRGVMKQMSNMSMMDRMKKLVGLGQSGALANGASLKQKERSKRNQLSAKEIARVRKKERQNKKQNRKRNKPKRTAPRPWSPSGRTWQSPRRRGV